MTKRFFMLLAVAMAAVVIHAEDFTANGIKYTGDESTKTATVTGTEDGFNQTDLVIPETVNGYTGPVHTTPAATDSTWYTLDGRRVKQPAAKGIYISNGRRIMGTGCLNEFVEFTSNNLSP